MGNSAGGSGRWLTRAAVMPSLEFGQREDFGPETGRCSPFGKQRGGALALLRRRVVVDAVVQTNGFFVVALRRDAGPHQRNRHIDRRVAENFADVLDRAEAVYRLAIVDFGEAYLREDM